VGISCVWWRISADDTMCQHLSVALSVHQCFLLSWLSEGQQHQFTTLKHYMCYNNSACMSEHCVETTKFSDKLFQYTEVARHSSIFKVKTFRNRYLALWTHPTVDCSLHAETFHVVESWTQLTAAIWYAAFRVTQPTVCIPLHTLHATTKYYCW